MGNMKLPWREVAAAAAGGLFVWAWRKQVSKRDGLVVLPLPPVQVRTELPVIAPEQLSTPDGETDEPPPEIIEALNQMGARLVEMLSAPPVYPEAKADLAITVHREQHMIEIHVSNPFAAAWVREQGKAFGMLLEPMMHGVPFILHVNKTIPVLEVADWLFRGWQKRGQDDGLAPVG